MRDFSPPFGDVGFVGWRISQDLHVGRWPFRPKGRHLAEGRVDFAQFQRALDVALERPTHGGLRPVFGFDERAIVGRAGLNPFLLLEKGIRSLGEAKRRLFVDVRLSALIARRVIDPITRPEFSINALGGRTTATAGHQSQGTEKDNRLVLSAMSHGSPSWNDLRPFRRTPPASPSILGQRVAKILARILQG
jgi:hypothetical protein